jgi:hypothetical protein
MILSTLAPRPRGLTATPLALLAILCVVSRSHANEPSDCHRIPAGSAGYVHVRVSEIVEAPQFDAIKRLQSHVRSETTAFSLSRLGLDVTTLSEVTLLFPPYDFVMKRKSENPFVLVATLSDAFQPEQFASRLSAQLGLSRDTNNLLTNGRDLAFFVASDHTVALGSPAALNWWLSNRNGRDSSRLAASRAAMEGQGQILAGWDATQIPDFSRDLPAPLQSLAKASDLAIAIRFDDGLSIRTSVAFDDEGAAKYCSQELQALVEQGSAYLSVAESKMELGLKNPNASTEEAFGAVVGLAFIREGAAHLDQVRIEQAGGRVDAEARLEASTTSLVLASLTAIRTIGRNAEAKFEAVAEQLDAP